MATSAKHTRFHTATRGLQTGSVCLQEERLPPGPRAHSVNGANKHKGEDCAGYRHDQGLPRRPVRSFAGQRSTDTPSRRADWHDMPHGVTGRRTVGDISPSRRSGERSMRTLHPWSPVPAQTNGLGPMDQRWCAICHAAAHEDAARKDDREILHSAPLSMPPPYTQHRREAPKVE